MDEQSGLIESLIEKGEQYGKTTLELLKLKTLDKSADVVSNLGSWLIVFIFCRVVFPDSEYRGSLVVRRIVGQILLWLFCCFRILCPSGSNLRHFQETTNQRSSQ